jgi:hypothetical protein
MWIRPTSTLRKGLALDFGGEYVDIAMSHHLLDIAEEKEAVSTAAANAAGGVITSNPDLHPTNEEQKAGTSPNERADHGGRSNLDTAVFSTATSISVKVFFYSDSPHDAQNRSYLPG